MGCQPNIAVSADNINRNLDRVDKLLYVSLECAQAKKSVV